MASDSAVRPVRKSATINASVRAVGSEDGSSSRLQTLFILVQRVARTISANPFPLRRPADVGGMRQ